MNKRGQGLSTTAIILIILGLVVLAALIYYFVLGGKNLTPYLNTGDNVNTIVTQCSTYCSLGSTSKYDFCTKNMTVNVNSKSYTGTCENLASGNTAKITASNGKAVSSADKNTILGFNIAPCPAITC